MRQQHVSSQMAAMENSTYEYYYDYLDPVIVDERKLKYQKYSIVIIFWVVLATFVLCLFLSLNLLSRSGNLPKTRTTSTNSLEPRSE